MSTVDKMLIKGIRSFDPENKNVVTFFKPLTLIVGPNGAGKTTIIECLKLSCTGELPPNARSGHSFIHDPKVAGETETKGQIKLRFKTAAGKDVVCIRSFQLTQKASKMEYKAIESVLQTINPHTGEKVCLSYRCADMDREIPALMGVSKAILENVIFVHQDEANWPLQDPSTLKKKFDDIFSATRYTKALEVIKKLHKDQAQEIKTYKLKLENLQTLKDSAYKLRENIVQDEERTESLKVQMQDLENKVQNVDAKIHQIETTLKDLRKLQEQVSTKTAERRTWFEQQQRQYEALEEENEDTDEEMIEWKTKFDEKIASLESKVRKLEREMNDMETKSSFLKQSITEYTQENFRLQTEADTSNNNEVKTAEDHYWDANDRWKNIEAQKHAKLEIKKLEVERKTNQLAERDFESNILRKESERYGIEQQIKAVEREREILARDSEDRVKLNLKKEELENIKKKHRKIIDEWKDRIKGVLKGRLPADKDMKKEIIQAQRALGTEYDDLNSKSREAEKEVNVLQMKIQEANNNLSKLRKDMDLKPVRLVLSAFHASQVILDYPASYLEYGTEWVTKFQGLTTRKRFIESKLQFLDQQSVTIDLYLKVLDSAKEKKDVQKSKYNIADGMRQMFDPFERVARAHHMCPCCERPFSVEEEDEFVKKQRVKAASSAEHMKVLAVESSNADSYFQQLDKLRMVYEEYIKIGKETIPSAEKNLQALTEELDQKSQALDDVLGVLAQIKAEKDSVEALVQPIETADRLYQEIQTLQVFVDDLEYKLDFRGQGIRSTEEIQSELSSLQDKRDALRTELEKLRDEQRYMENDLSNIQLRWHSLREEKLNVANTLINVKKAEEELERLVEEKKQVELDEKHLAEALGPLSKEREKLQSYLSELKVKLEQEYDEQKKQLDNYQFEVEALLKINSIIKEYRDLKKGEKFKEVQEKLSLSQSQLQICENRSKEILADLNRSKEILLKQDSIKRNIEDNLNYRKTKAEVDKLTQEIESLEERILNIGGVSTVEAELIRHSQERERLLSELNKCRGTMSVYQSNISKNKIDLKQSQYKDIDKRYFDQLIQLKTTEMANKDLDRYYNALDKALMRFHTMKMEEINKIIRELWQQTYRGQDIDYISIHSDSEGAGTRSYSYKVLMQTGDAELEMRGRCSAGQKVLASLIIRLALAETFCLNCGILALDEPTTNLDGPNAESLAAALLRIMEDRKGQENFQLIVITHDERFAQLIGQRQHAERYYRVAKDDHYEQNKMKLAALHAL
ncbi:hypothetical protein JCGZ_01086 [Jatropha curcas]|uniref:DNA repair protein RAD50 n=1 Tax=Jatropha curcas TaxID=180498 RepID=A0A067L5F8_JATCU|nr:hypothetical protein JCGZ_01086 [Jatropha curcas]